MLHSSGELPATVEIALPETACPVAASKSSIPCSPDCGQTLYVGALWVGAGYGTGVVGAGDGTGVDGVGAGVGDGMGFWVKHWLQNKTSALPGNTPYLLVTS